MAIGLLLVGGPCVVVLSLLLLVLTLLLALQSFFWSNVESPWESSLWPRGQFWYLTTTRPPGKNTNTMALVAVLSNRCFKHIIRVGGILGEVRFMH